MDIISILIWFLAFFFILGFFQFLTDKMDGYIRLKKQKVDKNLNYIVKFE